MQCITQFNGSKPTFIDGCKYCILFYPEKEAYSCDIDDTCKQLSNKCCDTEFCNINKTMGVFLVKTDFTYISGRTPLSNSNCFS
ncbi:hypothetical protein CSKR_114476, partial [Clonorchis sinensis]